MSGKTHCVELSDDDEELFSYLDSGPVCAENTSEKAEETDEVKSELSVKKIQKAEEISLSGLSTTKNEITTQQDNSVASYNNNGSTITVKQGALEETNVNETISNTDFSAESLMYSMTNLTGECTVPTSKNIYQQFESIDIDRSEYQTPGTDKSVNKVNDVGTGVLGNQVASDQREVIEQAHSDAINEDEDSQFNRGSSVKSLKNAKNKFYLINEKDWLTVCARLKESDELVSESEPEGNNTTMEQSPLSKQRSLFKVFKQYKGENRPPPAVYDHLIKKRIINKHDGVGSRKDKNLRVNKQEIKRCSEKAGEKIMSDSPPSDVEIVYIKLEDGKLKYECNSPHLQATQSTCQHNGAANSEDVKHATRQLDFTEKVQQQKPCDPEQVNSLQVKESPSQTSQITGAVQTRYVRINNKLTRVVESIGNNKLYHVLDVNKNEPGMQPQSADIVQPGTDILDEKDFCKFDESKLGISDMKCDGSLTQLTPSKLDILDKLDTAEVQNKPSECSSVERLKVKGDLRGHAGRGHSESPIVLRVTKSGDLVLCKEGVLSPDKHSLQKQLKAATTEDGQSEHFKTLWTTFRQKSVKTKTGAQDYDKYVELEDTSDEDDLSIYLHHKKAITEPVNTPPAQSSNILKTPVNSHLAKNSNISITPVNRLSGEKAEILTTLVNTDLEEKVNITTLPVHESLEQKANIPLISVNKPPEDKSKTQTLTVKKPLGVSPRMTVNKLPLRETNVTEPAVNINHTSSLTPLYKSLSEKTNNLSKVVIKPECKEKIIFVTPINKSQCKQTNSSARLDDRSQCVETNLSLKSVNKSPSNMTNPRIPVNKSPCKSTNLSSASVNKATYKKADTSTVLVSKPPCSISIQAAFTDSDDDVSNDDRATTYKTESKRFTDMDSYFKNTLLEENTKKKRRMGTLKQHTFIVCPYKQVNFEDINNTDGTHTRTLDVMSDEVNKHVDEAINAVIQYSYETERETDKLGPESYTSDNIGSKVDLVTHTSKQVLKNTAKPDDIINKQTVKRGVGPRQKAIGKRKTKYVSGPYIELLSKKRRSDKRELPTHLTHTSKQNLKLISEIQGIDSDQPQSLNRAIANNSNVNTTQVKENNLVKSKPKPITPCKKSQIDKTDFLEKLFQMKMKEAEMKWRSREAQQSNSSTETESQKSINKLDCTSQQSIVSINKGKNITRSADNQIKRSRKSTVCKKRAVRTLDSLSEVLVTSQTVPCMEQKISGNSCLKNKEKSCQKRKRKLSIISQESYAENYNKSDFSGKRSKQEKDKSTGVNQICLNTNNTSSDKFNLSFQNELNIQKNIAIETNSSRNVPNSSAIHSYCEGRTLQENVESQNDEQENQKKPKTENGTEKELYSKDKYAVKLLQRTQKQTRRKRKSNFVQSDNKVEQVNLNTAKQKSENDSTISNCDLDEEDSRKEMLDEDTEASYLGDKDKTKDLQLSPRKHKDGKKLKTKFSGKTSSPNKLRTLKQLKSRKRCRMLSKTQSNLSNIAWKDQLNDEAFKFEFSENMNKEYERVNVRRMIRKILKSAERKNESVKDKIVKHKERKHKRTKDKISENKAKPRLTSESDEAWLSDSGPAGSFPAFRFSPGIETRPVTQEQHSVEAARISKSRLEGACVSNSATVTTNKQLTKMSNLEEQMTGHSDGKQCIELHHSPVKDLCGSVSHENITNVSMACSKSVKDIKTSTGENKTKLASIALGVDGYAISACSGSGSPDMKKTVDKLRALLDKVSAKKVVKNLQFPASINLSDSKH